MVLLTLQKISHAFGGRPLLDNITLQINDNERICIIGRNGEGKSTLLKIANGLLVPNQGEVLRQQGLKIGFLQQELPVNLQGTVLQFVKSHLPAHHDDWEADQIAESAIRQVGLEGNLQIETLSGGQSRRVLLAAAIADQPDLLLLDEPTNHLDIPSIQWIENFLFKYPGALVFISHDRAFLRKLATRIVELDRGQLSSWECDYTQFLKRRENQLHAESIQWAQFDKKLAQEEAWIRQGIKARRCRDEGRVKALKKMRYERTLRRERHGEITMQIHEAESSGRKVIAVENASYRYPESSTETIPSFDLLLMRGDKLAIIGPNGCGKSTLIKLLLEQIPSASGSITHGTHLKIAYFDQNRQSINEQLSVGQNLSIHETIQVGDTKKHVISYLQDFLFSPDRIRQPAKLLSGGERNRLLLAKLFATPSNLLVLDEPTNDLDAETLELLEELLLNYEGTILLVSHDREFLDHIATSTLVFEPDHTLREYVGGYEDYHRCTPYPDFIIPSSSEEKEKSVKPKSTTIALNNIKPQNKKKLTFKEQRELEQLPDLITSKENELTQINLQLAQPDFFKQDKNLVNDILQQHQLLPVEIEQLTERWLELETRNNE